jgi:hypothetical protein
MGNEQVCGRKGTWEKQMKNGNLHLLENPWNPKVIIKSNIQKPLIT